MENEKKSIEKNELSHALSEVSLTPPPVPAKGKTKVTVDQKKADEAWPIAAPPGCASPPKLDLNDREAVKAAAKKWIEEQSSRSCIA